MPSSSRALRPRGPGYAFSALATATLVLLGLVALNASQPPPPTVAEFAPAALDQIKDAPERQSTDVGSAETGARGGQSAGPKPGRTSLPPSPPAPTQPAIEVARTLRCFGDPPRQIEDPQSPPCVNYWKGDNGGATASGVTADEIRVAFPFGTAFTGDPSPGWRAMTNFFNQKFQFYGRKMRFMGYAARGDNFAMPVPADMIADATYVASELKAFASLGYPDRKGAEQTYYDELARRKVISVIGRETAKGTEPYLAKKHPYVWNRGVAIDTMLAQYGQHLCASWANRGVKYGGPVWPFEPQPTTRKLGILVTEAQDGTRADIKPLLTNLAVCGERPYTQTAPVSAGQEDAVNPILQMVQQKVTTIVCVCDVGSARNYLNAAEGQGYRPEWLMGTYINNDVDNAFSASPPAQARNVFGISHLDKFQPIQDSWWYHAQRTGDPSLPPPTTATGVSTYQNLLLLASGIQMAGPNLTPETFAAALQRTTFPNPGARRGPYFQGRVGFEGGKHSMRGDASMFWYDQTKRGYVDPSLPGRVCHVRGGLRYGTGDWPKEEPPYRTACV